MSLRMTLRHWDALKEGDSIYLDGRQMRVLQVLPDNGCHWTYEIRAYEVGTDENDWVPYFRSFADCFTVDSPFPEIETMHEEQDYNQ